MLNRPHNILRWAAASPGVIFPWERVEQESIVVHRGYSIGF